MTSSVHFNETMGILTVTQSGEVTMASRQKLLEEILVAIPEKGLIKVLSDLREADVTMSHEQCVKFGEIIVEEAGSREAFIAMVHNPDSSNNYLMESVLLLEGDFLRLVAFTSHDEAYQWLVES